MVRQSLRRLGRDGKLGLLAGCAMMLAGPALAQQPPTATIERIKQSIVAVGSFDRLRSPQFVFSGTGFVVGDGLQIATNDHVLPKTIKNEAGETLAIAIPAPGNRAQIRPARKLTSDAAVDLAVLRIEGPALPVLALGDGERVREGESYLLTGFPIGAVLGLFPVTHRSMIAAVAPIVIPAARADQLDARSVRRINQGAFPIFQLDGIAYPGNSGSPVYHPETGVVIGIVNSVFVRGTREAAISHPSGITYAIPVQQLKELLDRAK